MGVVETLFAGVVQGGHNPVEVSAFNSLESHLAIVDRATSRMVQCKRSSGYQLFGEFRPSRSETDLYVHCESTEDRGRLLRVDEPYHAAPEKSCVPGKVTVCRSILRTASALRERSMRTQVFRESTFWKVPMIA